MMKIYRDRKINSALLLGVIEVGVEEYLEMGRLIDKVSFHF